MAGAVTILPPTWAVLDELTAFQSVDNALIAAGDERVIEAVTPGWVDDGDEVRVLLPGDPEYPGDDPGDPAVGADGVARPA